MHCCGKECWFNPFSLKRAAHVTLRLSTEAIHRPGYGLDVLSLLVADAPAFLRNERILGYWRLETSAYTPSPHHGPGIDVIRILGFFAQTPEKVYSRDETRGTSSGVTAIGPRGNVRM